MGFSLRYSLMGPALFRAANLFGRCLGAILYRVPPPGSKQRMRADLSSVLPTMGPKEIEATMRAFFKDYTLNKLDVFFYPLMSAGNIVRFAELEGANNIEEALKAGKGVVLMHSHLGNPQMLMPAIGHRGYRLCQVGMAPEDVYADVREITGGGPNLPALLWLKVKGWLEGYLPVEFIHMRRASMRDIYRSLQDNKLVAMTVDGVDRGDGVREFLGRKCGLFVSGPARVAQKSSAALLPLFVTRMPDGRHKVSIEPAITVDPTLGRDEAVEAYMSAYLGLLGSKVRQHPHHYGRFLGFHNDRFFEADRAAGAKA